MLKFIKGKGHQPSAERLKLQKELFQFSKTIAHGFPHRPSGLAWDPKLKLMAIGTRNGQIRVYGKPGVEYGNQHENEAAVTHIQFLENQGRLITLLDDSTLHLWQIDVKDNRAILTEVKDLELEKQLQKVSATCIHSNNEQLWLGTESGNVYTLDVLNLKVLEEKLICQDVVMQSVPDDFKVNPGAVEAISQHPADSDKILIGYNRGLIVLWDCSNMVVESTFVGNQQQLESVSWHKSGKFFISAHNDGSYIMWDVLNPSKPKENPQSPYGPFPCKSITKLIWNAGKDGDDFIVFTGGMPRASYGDRHTLSIISGEKHQVLDFTSKVVDFFTIDDDELGCPKALIALVEEEIVAIDLLSEGFPQLRLPYLSSLHSSAITCSQHCGDVPEELWNKIVLAGKKQTDWKYSNNDWPIDGGVNEAPTESVRDLLLTGHEDGTIRFWNASGIALHHLYTLKTSAFFVSDDPEQSPSEEEEWPPFRKVGTFDPYSDDPRLAIKKTLLCVLTGTLIVAGTAGQVLVLKFNTEESDKELEVCQLNIVGDRDSFVWKGHDQLSNRQGTIKLDPGFQPSVIIQLSPPAAITALAFHTEWSLVAAGTAHGFGLFDYAQKKSVMAKCTLNPNDMTAAGDISMSRRKSFKKSLRESFRRLRKGRSQRNKREKTPEPKTSSPKETRKDDEGLTSPSIETKPVERAIEARSNDDALGSMVRCLYLAKSFIVNSTMMSPTLWAGTNSGAIFVFTISIPGNDKRNSESVACQLGKEIQLKHRAPVINIQILDHTGYPLPEPMEIANNRAKAPDTVGSHRVLICSEEQFKIFTLPSLKPYCKFKLTAHEGSRVRKVGMAKFRHRTDESYSEYCMTCLTNQGDVSIFTVPDLRRQLVKNCIKREDINGISSLVFARTGHGFYLHSPCEFLRFSLSTTTITDVKCHVELPEGARPAVVTITVEDDDEESTLEPETNGDATEEEIQKVEDNEREIDAKNEEIKKEEQSSPVKDIIEKEIKKKTSSLKYPILEVNGEKEINTIETAYILKTVTKDINTSQISQDSEDKRELDITVDSIKDHFPSLAEESSVVVVEKREESRTIKTQETTVTMTSKSFTSEAITNSITESED